MSVQTEPERRNFIPALSYPQYRFLWFSAIGTHIGRWIDTAIGAWLVLEMTDSAFLVGLLGAFRYAAMLLGPFSGTIADRLNRRLILLIVQVLYGTAAFVIFLLFYFSRLEVWHLFAFTLVGGFAFTFDFSTRYAVAADIVKSNHMVSAVSLLMVVTGFSSILGPLIGGFLVEGVGAIGCFAMIAASFLCSFSLLLPMKITGFNRPVGKSIFQDLVSGLRYIRSSEILLSLTLIATLANFFLFPYLYTLVPIFARDIIHTSASGYGQLMASVGVGMVAGSFLLGVLPPSANRGRFLVVTTLLWPASLLILSASHTFAVSILVLIMTGFAQGLSMTLIQSLLLSNSSEEMRGRVFGARALAIGALPFGNVLTGYGAGFLGAPAMLVINSIAAIAVSVLISARGNLYRK